MVILIEAETKRWGNSIGVVIPSDVVDSEGLKENQKVDLLLVTNGKALRETFGALKGKWKKSTQQIKDELRKDLYD